MKDLVFHIGHHKTATTWLQNGYFADHTEINLVSDSRQPWNDGFLSYLIGTTERKFNVSRCREIFQKQATACNDIITVTAVSAERISGHPYSGGYDSLTLADRIYLCFPDAKIIIGIRNQVNMIVSVYKQLVAEGYLGTFSDLLNSNYWKGTAFSMDMYEYDLLISKYHNLFSPDRVLVLVYEDIKDDPKGFVDKISSFLGVSNFRPHNLGRVDNKAKKNSAIRLTRFLNHFQKTELNPFPLIKINPFIVRALRKLLTPLFIGEEIITDEEIAHIKSYYHESNDVLRKYLERDLPDYS